MALKLMYITNNPEIAIIAESVGIDRIFIDMEYIGKDIRQGGKDTVQNHHTLQDIKNIKKVVKNSEIMVRCNPIHDATKDYCSSKEEIDNIISSGADIIMLPFFKTTKEVEKFLKLVDGRVKTLPLVETPEAVECIDEILNLEGLEEIFVGLNDLSLGYGKRFMFELLIDGTVEHLTEKFKKRGISFGFGGIAGIGKGTLSAEKIITEHYRLGSSCVILSRSFCNAQKIGDIEEIKKIFEVGVMEIRDFEKNIPNDEKLFFKNKAEVERAVGEIVNSI